MRCDDLIVALVEDQEIRALGEKVAVKNGWKKVEFTMGSGSLETIADIGIVEDYPLLPSEGSAKGQQYRFACNDVLCNEGEMRLRMGMPQRTRFHHEDPDREGEKTSGVGVEAVQEGQ